MQTCIYVCSTHISIKYTQSEWEGEGNEREGQGERRGDREGRRGERERDEAQRSLILNVLIVPVPHPYPGTSRMWFQLF